MARATFVKKAQKDYPQHGIAKGESYYWWKFRMGGKHYSKTQPMRSQLTQSAFYSQVFDLQDRIAELSADDSLPSEVEDIVSSLRDIAGECEDSRSNMPDQLQDSDSGQLLQDRVDAMNDAADNLEGIDFDDAPDETIECEHCAGDGMVFSDIDEAGEKSASCLECSGSGQVENEEDAESYWQNKLEEVQGVDIDTP